MLVVLQTVEGVESASICKEEWQAFMEYFVGPLMAKAINERLLREVLKAPSYESPAPNHAKLTFAQVVAHTSKKLREANRALLARKWEKAPNVSYKAYQPSEVPFFVTIDNASVHSYWIDLYKKHLDWPGVSLLQLIRMPPHGHDLHQLVEHANGVVKSHVTKKIRALMRRTAGQHIISADDIHLFVQEGKVLFTAESHEKNIRRVFECLKVVVAEKGEKVQVLTGSGKIVWAEGTRGWQAPNGIA